MKRLLHPKGSAEIMGAYSHGVSVDLGNSEMIFVTGQIAMDAQGNAVAPDDIEEQTRYVFESIANILKESHATLADIVKVVIYITDMNDFPKISAIRNEFLKESKPVSTLVEISSTVKKGCDIEIDAIAIRKK